MTHKPEPDATRLTLDILMAWYACGLPADAAQHGSADIERLIVGFRALPPPPFDLQAHHFAPLLEALADE